MSPLPTSDQHLQSMPPPLERGKGSELIAIRDLKVHFDLGGGGLFDRLFGGKSARRVVKAVDGVSIDIYPGETLGLVGESGCGKSTLGRAILRLTEPTGGQVLFRGEDLANLSQREMRQYRKHLQMIFQDPYASLNPRMTVGQIIGEPLETFSHEEGKENETGKAKFFRYVLLAMSTAALVRGIFLGGIATIISLAALGFGFFVLVYVVAKKLSKGGGLDPRVMELMETVGLNKRFIKRYPHEFSGGQRQRIGIARALAVNPDFVVADEPISALDVSIQAQIMNLMERLQREKNLTYLFISHDLRAIRHVSDRVAVMYLGKLVEIADARVIYDEPLMPYTKALISAVPVPDPEIEATRQRIVLEGDVPSPINPPQGCRFHTRCPYAIEACKEVVPPLAEIKPNHFAACIRISPAEPDIEQVAPGDAPGLRDPQRVIAT